MRRMEAKWVGVVVGTVALLASGAAVAQGDLPGHLRYRAVTMAAPAGLADGQPGGMPAAEGGQNGQVKDDLFEGTEVFAKNATGVTEINMGPSALDLVGGPDGHKAHRTVLNVVRTYTYEKPGMYNMADVDRFRAKLSSGDWSCSVHIRELKTGESTDVCNKKRTDGLQETAIITVEPKELTFIHTIRKAGPGESEMGGFPMMYGVPGLPAMAMLNPRIIIDLQMALHGLPGELGMIKVLPRIDSEQMARQMEEFQKKMNSPEMQQKMKDFQLKFKDFENSPEMRQRMDELKKGFDQPKADEKEKGSRPE